MTDEHQLPSDNAKVTSETNPQTSGGGPLRFIWINRHWLLIPMLLVIVAILAFAFYVDQGEPQVFTRF